LSTFTGFTVSTSTFFIAGVLPGTHFQRDWEEQWRRLGGDTACLQKFDWPWVKGYLKSFPPDRRFEVELKFVFQAFRGLPFSGKTAILG
jgi:hypothetical protein